MVQDGLFECRIEVSVVEKHVWIMKPPIEMSLH